MILPTHLTIAKSTGFAHLALQMHFAGGLIGLVTGFLAVSVRKGGMLHRQAGMIFVYAMITAMIIATGIGIYEGKSTAFGTPFAAYLVFTGMTAVRPVWERRQWDAALMIIPVSTVVLYVIAGIRAYSASVSEVDGAPLGMLLFLTTIALLAAVGDLRMIRAGELRGAKRIARHLWRMCFAFFVATGSFFFG